MCDDVRVCVQPPILMIASGTSGDGNVRTLFITDPLLSSRDNFGGYRDSIAAAIHYAEYPLTRRTCNSEIKKTRNIYDCEISACTFWIKRLREQSGYYEMLFNPTLFILRLGLEREVEGEGILEITERKNASRPNVRGDGGDGVPINVALCDALRVLKPAFIAPRISYLSFRDDIYQA